MGKQWKAIAGTVHPGLRLALTQIPEDSEDGQALKRGFPFCFTEGVSAGPVPLSEILRVGWKHVKICMHPDMDTAAEELGVPVVYYALSKDSYEPDSESMVGLLSEEWQSKNSHEFGDVVSIEGYRYVVLDNVEHEELLLAPIERVHPDTKDLTGRDTTA